MAQREKKKKKEEEPISKKKAKTKKTKIRTKTRKRKRKRRNMDLNPINNQIFQKNKRKPPLLLKKLLSMFTTKNYQKRIKPKNQELS